MDRPRLRINGETPKSKSAMRRHLLLLALVPALCGFDPQDSREALDGAFHNLYGVDLLAAVELEISGDGRGLLSTGFAYGRKTKGGETRTLLFTFGGGRDAGRALMLQRPGEGDRIFMAEGTYGNVRPVATGRRGWGLFGSDFSYEDFRAHSSDEYRVEVLGTDVVEGEPCRVLRLRPFEGPYTTLLVWLSTRRPVIPRIDYFDRRGLWKRYRAKLAKLTKHFEWWVPMEDEMLDLRTGRRTRRHVRNLVVDAEVPDDVFTLTQLSRGRLPGF